MSATLTPASAVAPAVPFPEKPKASPSTAATIPDSPAASRLEASRACIRSGLLEFAGSSDAHGTGFVDKFIGSASQASVLGSLQRWTRRVVGSTAGRTSRAALGPVAQTHPALLLGAAAATGALLVLMRPWRLLLRPSVLFGLVSLAATHLVRSRSKGEWLMAALKLTKRMSRRRL